MNERDRTRIRAEQEIDQSVEAVGEFIHWLNENIEAFVTLFETLATDPTLPITLSGEEREIAFNAVRLLALTANLHHNFQVADENKPEG